MTARKLNNSQYGGAIIQYNIEKRSQRLRNIVIVEKVRRLYTSHIPVAPEEMRYLTLATDRKSVALSVTMELLSSHSRTRDSNATFP